MKSKKLYTGYKEYFLSDDIEVKVSLPQLNTDQSKDLVVDNEENEIIHYINYSLQLSATHKFPYYTAANIDGKLFKKISRKDNWRKDPRVLAEMQFGKELYAPPQSNFDRGHMTKREDVQWGKNEGIALNAADATFYYTNSVPQHQDLNRDIWRNLEDYILHKEAKQKTLRICVFTGPVLSDENPYLVFPIEDNLVRIPVLFWKVVVFQKEDGNLCRVGFMMSQNRLLIEHGIVDEYESTSTDSDLFMQFDDAETYQVNISLIEQFSGLAMPSAIDAYTDSRSTKLVMKEIDIDPELESDSAEERLGFWIEGITF
ncbi:MAG: DNA/RNA non-specific endonuclease [Sphingobacteriales bacterium]|nr:MAG: DNA/RNA non-specific endonuclease [Sphingobacteriales bacterium]